ncbi:hypothetical protein T581_03434, partial [Mycobacterium tuberculosis UT0048]
MGHRVDTLSDRQRANLTTGATDRAIRLVVLALLTVDGVVSA